MILKFSDFLAEAKKISEKKKSTKAKEKIEESCPVCGRKLSECDSPDCGAGFYGPELSNPVYH